MLRYSSVNLVDSVPRSFEYVLLRISMRPASQIGSSNSDYFDSGKQHPVNKAGERRLKDNM